MKTPIEHRIGWYIALIATSLATSGCATVWSDGDKRSLSSVSIGEIAVADDAYHAPDARKSPGMGNAIRAATGGGLIPALIGSAIDASVMAAQQKNFEQSAKQYFDQIAAVASAAPTGELGAALHEGLSQDSFFGSRLAGEAPNTFHVEVTSFGLVRSDASADKEVRLAFAITAKVKLSGPRGKVFLERSFTGVSYLSDQIGEIAGGTKPIDQMRAEAALACVGELCAEMNRRLGNGKANQSLQPTPVAPSLSRQATRDLEAQSRRG